MKRDGRSESCPETIDKEYGVSLNRWPQILDLKTQRNYETYLTVIVFAWTNGA
jgi:hypothetical protein